MAEWHSDTRLIACIPNGVYPGKKIFITGIPRAKTRFCINLQEGTLQNCDIGFHCSVRFNDCGDINAIVRNHRSGTKWGTEERAVPHFPFVPNCSFEMTIHCENIGFTIDVNNKFFTEFQHRLMPFARFNILNIQGDIDISQIRFQ